MSTNTEHREFSYRNVQTIFKREFQNYFNTAIGYVALFIFSLVLNFLFFNIRRFWEAGQSSTDALFSMMRITFIFFIPAITMRLWAEEKKSGTIELLFTLPMRDNEIIAGKFISAVSFLLIGLATTLLFPLTLEILSEPDWALIIGGYLGAFLLGSSYIALGLYISWLTQDQIIAFLATLSICFILFIMGYQPFLQLLGPLSPMFAFLSASWHFDALSKGLFDTRDILYFLTLIWLFLYLNKRSIQNRR